MTKAIKGFLWPKGSNKDVWALVDGARDSSIYWSLANSYLHFSCLFAGQLPAEVERVAPYLIEIVPDDTFTNQLLRGWGNSLGIYLECDRPLPELRHHLRRFLTVTDAAGDRLLFRYYDPRVMRAYLPTCRADELKTVFGPIKAFWMEARNSETMLEFRFNGSSLQVAEHVLKDDSPGNFSRPIPS